MRLGVIANRIVLVDGDTAVDIEQTSSGRFPADPERPEARTCGQCPYNAICTESWTARQVRGGVG